MSASLPGSFVADLHIHSAYAFACSKALTLDNLAKWARRKGIDLLATGDFTHPIWAGELRASLTETGDGLYEFGGTQFVPGTEISCVYRQDGRTRRIHLLVLMPTLESAAVFTQTLANFGKLENDGRPTVSLSARDLLETALGCHPESIVIPAHAWTPWYGVYGSKAGFDSLEECFADLTPLVRAVETGLSSDPAMNRAVRELDRRAVVSFSDAHSPANLGREVTAFARPFTWDGLADAISAGSVAYTVEFYPEEGKYHYSGHRKCGISFDTSGLAQNGPLCPVCGRPLTLGVLHRVNEVSRGVTPCHPRPDADGFVRVDGGTAPYARLIPLREIVAAVRGVGVNTRTVERQCAAIAAAAGSELNALLWASPRDLQEIAGEEVAAAITQSRTGQVRLTPGFDGQYGSVSLAGL